MSALQVCVCYRSPRTIITAAISNAGFVRNRGVPDASNVPPRRHRFRAFGQRGGRRRFDRARLAAATTDLHFPKQFVDEVHRWAEANYDKLGQLAQEAHQDPRANMESPILELAMTAFQAGGAPKKGDHG